METCDNDDDDDDDDGGGGVGRVMLVVVVEVVMGRVGRIGYRHMGMGHQMVSVDVVVVTEESFSLLRNRTVNVFVGLSPGIGYPSSSLIPDKTRLVNIRTSPLKHNQLL